ncbi:cytochrome c-type biogenesis protein CcmH [Candidatus Pseudothioglobus sp. Uisw_086]|uniref:cytochrome c-type biogenesis protein n=1 Tax=Candidatus Pseudothioglobus sp. Uisw_086 TaxID=3230998 RepID=UPI003A85E6D8
MLTLLLIQGAFAESIEAKDFETLYQENRYTVLIENIRCPVCQGQSIGGSNSSLAGDLREQVRKMILNNKSDKDIYLFMVERYGDFVNFKPPINSKTYLLWFAPLLLLVLCSIYLFRITRNKNIHLSSSDSDIERAKKLLK